jgi:hypothetical protein
MGIGSRLVKPWTRSLPLWALLFGCLLPDLIDKPIYYGQVVYTHFSGGGMGAFNNSRTIGHTAIFLLVFTAIAMWRRSRLLAAMALGIATHLVLDNLNDGLVGYMFPELRLPPEQRHQSTLALFWPFLQSYFPAAPYSRFSEYLSRSFNPLSIGFEVVGAAILAWDTWQNRHESEILEFFARRRLKRREARLKWRQSRDAGTS